MDPRIATALERARAGDLAGGEEALLVVLREPTRTAVERARSFAELASCYRSAGQRADALRVARDACVIAAVCDDDRVTGRAELVLGSAAIDVYFADQAAPELLAEGMQALARSAEAYERVGAIDFASVLLTMAELARALGELDAAAPLYERVSRDLADSRWAEPALHAQGLRGRAFMGLGAIELARGNPKEAANQFEIAVRFLGATNDPGAVPLLEELVALFEQMGERAAAARTRAAISTVL